MTEIDYTEKIATFNLLVGNENEEIAFNYLTLTNWDETKAAMLYNKENKGAQNTFKSSTKITPYENKFKKTNKSNYIYNDFDYSDNYNNLLSYSYNFNYQPYKKQKVNITKLNKYRECPIFKKGFFDSLKIFKSDNRSYFDNFSYVYNKCVKFYNTFIYELRTKVGIILLYSDRTLHNAIDILRNIINNGTTKDLLKTKAVVYPLISSSLEGSQISKKFKLRDKIRDFPVILICFYKNEQNFAVIELIRNINENFKLLNEKLFEAHDLFNDHTYKNLDSFTNNISSIINEPKNYISTTSNKSNNNYKINTINKNNNTINNLNNKNENNFDYQNIINDINNYLPEDINKDIKTNRDSYTYMTDGEILARQEREMKKLEKMEETKRLEEEKKEREKKEEEEKKKQEELIEKIQIDSLLNILPGEPSDDNPDKCIILFRFPDGEKVVQRKFLKTDNVSLLYLYVKSLGREIYEENDERHFSLIQSFPFKNFDEFQNNSLEEEGLFPNAVLQIKTSE